MPDVPVDHVQGLVMSVINYVEMVIAGTLDVQMAMVVQEARTVQTNAAVTGRTDTLVAVMVAVVRGVRVKQTAELAVKGMATATRIHVMALADPLLTVVYGGIDSVQIAHVAVQALTMTLTPLRADALDAARAGV